MGSDIPKHFQTALFHAGISSFYKSCVLKDINLGWDGRIRTYGTLYQKQLPYHLATSQQVQGVYALIYCYSRQKCEYYFIYVFDENFSKDRQTS